MNLKTTILIGGYVLGTGLIAITAFTHPPAVVVFDLPRDAAALKSFNATEKWRIIETAIGALLVLICSAFTLVTMVKKRKQKNRDNG